MFIVMVNEMNEKQMRISLKNMKSLFIVYFYTLN